MGRLQFSLTPQTAFATPLSGDTLFGQCCWAIRQLYGEAKLNGLLQGYADNQPFMVVSNPLPRGFLARPTVPAHLLGFNGDNAQQRKAQKAQKWLPDSVLGQPLQQWANAAKTEAEMMAAQGLSSKTYLLAQAQDHNSLNRLTGTTGKDAGFAPFQRQTFWYDPGLQLSLIVELDTQRFSAADLLTVLQQIGLQGYGKEASCGLGKFTVALDERPHPACTTNPNAWLTLAPCAPQGLSWYPDRCYYQILTRFGRHGDIAVHLQGGAFKNPVLMAAPFAVLAPQHGDISQGYTGQGIPGVSQTIQGSVHQGYAPVYPVRLEVPND